MTDVAVRFNASVVSAAPTGPRFRGLFPGQLLRYRRPVLWQELVLVGIGYYLYREARNLVPNQPSIAYRHGNSVQWLQEHLHLNFELSVNQFVQRHRLARPGDELLLRDAALRRDHRRSASGCS